MPQRAGQAQVRLRGHQEAGGVAEAAVEPRRCERLVHRRLFSDQGVQAAHLPHGRCGEQKVGVPLQVRHLAGERQPCVWDGPAVASGVAGAVQGLERRRIGDVDRAIAMSEYVIQHLLQLDRRLLGCVIADAFGKAAGIQGFHRQGEQGLGSGDSLLRRRAPPPAGILRCRADQGLHLAVHPGHHGIEIQQRVPGALAHHLAQGRVLPALCALQQGPVKGLLLNRQAARHRAQRRRHQAVWTAQAAEPQGHPPAAGAEQQRGQQRCHQQAPAPADRCASPTLSAAHRARLNWAAC